MYQNIIKPTLDITVALIAFIVAFPIFLILVLCLMVVNQGSPFFYQLRPGKHGQIFKIIKFKTMRDDTDSKGRLLSDAERLTTFGKIVRKTSLDEIPQLINVIKGDMSIVGPRPLLPAYLNLYTPEQNKRHLVKPGITGWAQVNGRNAISYTEKFKFDVWYINNMSFILDIKIIIKTVEKVFKGSDINAAKQATTAPFDGSN
jgi:lipopolysaccharide/colanic/teichoic acid biosynthesis glycosyltransferase